MFDMKIPAAKIPEEYQNAITHLLGALAGKLEKESDKAYNRSKIWLPVGAFFSIATPVLAFTAGFGGLKDLTFATALSFIAGLFGAVSIALNRVSKTWGTDERFRGEALDNLAWEVHRTLADYVMYQQALSKSRPLEGFRNEPSILAWLSDQTRMLMDQATTLRRFIFKPEALRKMGPAQNWRLRSEPQSVQPAADGMAAQEPDTYDQQETATP